MSDILIRGMKMYERCNDQNGHWSCPLFGSAYPYGFFCKVTTKEIGNPFSKQPDCPLIPVPPHGRLIDADALCMKLKMMYAKAFGEGNTAYHAAYRSLERVVSHEPTIIPAEEE